MAIDDEESHSINAAGGDAVDITVTPSTVSFSASTLQICILVSIVLDFAGTDERELESLHLFMLVRHKVSRFSSWKSGCIFSNIGLSMAGSGLYQGTPMLVVRLF